MSALLIVIAAASLFLLVLVALFVWSVKRGQFDDLNTPAQRVLLEDLDEPERNE